MKVFGKALTVAAVALMVATPALADAPAKGSSASALSVGKAASMRASTKSKGANKLGEDGISGGTIAVGVLAAAAIAAGIYGATNHSSNSDSK